jgi:hypothetical protein
MKKLSVAILSVALSVNSFAGGNDDWVGPLIVGGIAGALIANHVNKSSQTGPSSNEVYVQPGIDCRPGMRNMHSLCPGYPEPTLVIQRVPAPESTLVERRVIVNNNVTFPSNTPPMGYHFQYIYDNYCNCYKQALVPN